MLYNDVKTVPRCFATLKATPKASEHTLGSFEKIFSSNFQPSEAIFAYGADHPFENGNLRGFSKPKGFFQMETMIYI